MSHWWRAYNEAVDDPKLCLLSDRAHRGWFNLLCLASSNEGKLPSMEVMSLKLRMSASKVAVILAELVNRGLIDKLDDGMCPHNWNGRQYKSDVSTERVKRFRSGQRNVSEAPPENREQNTDSERKEDKTAGAASFAFVGGIISLTEKHFADWTKAFSNLDLRGELTARDAWLGSDRATDADRKNWFISTSKYLANRNMEAKAKVAANGPHGVGAGKAGRQDRFQQAYDQLKRSVAEDDGSEAGSEPYPRLLSNS